MFKNLGFRSVNLIDHSDRTSPAELFHPADEHTIRQDIIAFCFHHYHEIALTLHVEKHLGFASALRAKEMKLIHGGFRSVFQRNADPQGAWQRHLNIFQRKYVADSELRVGPFFNAYPSSYQH